MPDSTTPLRQIFQTGTAPGFAGVVQRVLAIDKLSALYGRATGRGSTIFDGVIESLRVTPVVSAADLARIPRSGPVVAIANHPFGLIEGAILGSIFSKARPDFRLMVNSLLDSMPELQQYFICVDPFGGAEATRSNLRGLKACLSFLQREKGLLAVFPAGEVAHMQIRRGEVTDPEWNLNVARLIRRTGASVLPMYFDGGNSPLFHLAGMIHPRLRTALLPHEFLNKQDQRLELRIGAPIGPKRLAEFGSEEALTAYLRKRTFLLRHRESTEPRRRGRIFAFPRPALPRVHFFKTAQERVIDAVEPSLIESEIGLLQPLLEQSEYAVYIAAAHEIPSVLREISRLREITFRAAGEGSGKSRDTDSFDAHYKHLFVWRKDARYVVGAYRLGETSAILEKFGAKGLYTSTLFSYKQGFLDRIESSLELGRSFVRPEEQRNYAPLLLLWKGIGAYVSEHPHLKVLFGPVSISANYQAASRRMIVSFFRGLRDAQGLQRFVRARNPFGIRPAKEWQEFGDITAWDLDELSECVAELERDQKGVPILLRQYMKLGGKLLAFNVDARFSNSLDGLILVDLTETDPRIVERYLGKAGAKRFFAQHKSAVAV
ncbi:MAG: GNAT family N-acyltransferase [Bryobacteraceae bacterium]